MFRCSVGTEAIVYRCSLALKVLCVGVVQVLKLIFVGVVLALKVPQLCLRKQNLDLVLNTLNTVTTLHQTQPTIQVVTYQWYSLVGSYS